MDTTTNDQATNQINQNLTSAVPADLAVTKDMPKSDVQAAINCEPNKEAAQATTGEQNAPTTQAAQTEQTAAPKDHKDQLYRRVTARMDDIEKALASLSGNDVNSEHANALRLELANGKDAMSGGWEHVGEMEAARLSKWLESSQVLVGSGRVDPASAGANLDPASGMPANTSLPADGAPAVDGGDISVKATETPHAS
jgi:hypothetical protein